MAITVAFHHWISGLRSSRSKCGCLAFPTGSTFRIRETLRSSAFSVTREKWSLPFTFILVFWQWLLMLGSRIALCPVIVWSSFSPTLNMNIIYVLEARPHTLIFISSLLSLLSLLLLLLLLLLPLVCVNPSRLSTQYVVPLVNRFSFCIRSHRIGWMEDTNQKNKMPPTNPNAHTYVNGTDVQTHGYAVTQNTFLQ